jgi:NAD(P)-dependent dehydrogenase (short-subunit alcohol dehydrogenase family)
MIGQFDGTTVLVLGASGGVGKYGPGKAVAVQADLTEIESLQAGVDTVVSSFGQLDGCLDTVGTALRMKPFLDIPEHDIDSTIAVELRSVITVARATLPHLIASGRGRLVFVGSDSGKVGTSGEAISAACRGGIIALAKSLAREYARKNVLVNVICPGPTATGLWDDLVKNDEFGGKLGIAMVRAIPLRRIAAAEEVASAAVFLLSAEASFITGQAISVSGGLTMS